MLKAFIPYDMPPVNSYLKLMDTGYELETADNLNIAPTWLKIDDNEPMVVNNNIIYL